MFLDILSGAYPDTSTLTSSTPTTATLLSPPSSKVGYLNGGSKDANELSKRISCTLARHGIDESQNKRNSYVDNSSYSSNMGTGGKDNSSYNNYSNGDSYSSLSWRRKLDDDTSRSVFPSQGSGKPSDSSENPEGFGDIFENTIVIVFELISLKKDYEFFFYKTISRL